MSILRARVWCLLAFTCGCAARPGAGPSAPEAPSEAATPPPVVEVPRTVITPGEAVTIDELFDRATAALLKGDMEAAAADFDRVFSLDPKGPRAAEALFRAGVAHDESGRYEVAESKFEQVARRFPEHQLARESLLRSIRVLLYLESWERAGQVAMVFSKRYVEQTPVEQVLLHGARAHAFLAAGDVDRAHTFVEKGRGVVERRRLDSVGRLPRDVAQLYFALGEIRRMRGEAIVFTPLPPDFPIKLEMRAQLLLDAQNAYSETMRALDPHWSAMAGFRVGELYERLHVELMKIPAPDTADTKGRRDLFEGAMRLRYSVLLEKGKNLMDRTLAMAKRTGEKSAWVARAREARARIEGAIRREDEAIDRLPYTRAQLREALEELKKKYRKKS